MEMIRIYNYRTDEVLEKTFTTSDAADEYETLLEFLGASYERFHNGIKI